MPLEIVQREYRPKEELTAEIKRLARYFKVSTLVVLRRIYDIGGLTASALRQAYAEELGRLLAVPKGSGG